MKEWPLVGRDAVMERLEALLAAGESAGGVMLAGTPGVGKSRVGRECLLRAAKAGYATMRVAAIEAASSIPFGAFAPLLPASLPAADRAERHQEMLQGAAARILEAGGGRPVGLLIDDAHLLDGASATLAYQLALMPRVFVILAVALGEPAPDAVTGLWKDGVVERLDLGPMDADTIGELLVEVLGGAVESETLEYVQSRSSGNVLFLRHLVLAALQSEALREDDGVWRLVRPLDEIGRAHV
jgi:predicted ATPase